ncbi:hypothetical protein [Actinomycetospora cinnamomea]|uniref:Uncharacterized protein n=1 Tax=Actinomycetospora cinnamomea TaxID=663609 RepID=A0A2U1FAA5_9PSEU|nr:hypothetical protein [Actinomycetospora cinnamomea]PVZ09104.1 hypothetical protein C8D89_107268 [Actinomycetospora cinnamomea]
MEERDHEGPDRPDGPAVREEVEELPDGRPIRFYSWVTTIDPVTEGS